MVRFASEDVGLADPQALVHALAARESYHLLGTPEGELAIAQAVVYLALAPKSNAVNKAVDAAIKQPRNLQKPFGFSLLKVGDLLAVADPNGDWQVIRGCEDDVNACENVDPEGIERRDHHPDGARSSRLHSVD